MMSRIICSLSCQENNSSKLSYGILRNKQVDVLVHLVISIWCPLDLDMFLLPLLDQEPTVLIRWVQARSVVSQDIQIAFLCKCAGKGNTIYFEDEWTNRPSLTYGCPNKNI